MDGTNGTVTQEGGVVCLGSGLRFKTVKALSDAHTNNLTKAES